VCCLRSEKIPTLIKHINFKNNTLVLAYPLENNNINSNNNGDNNNNNNNNNNNEDNNKDSHGTWLLVIDLLSQSIQYSESCGEVDYSIIEDNRISIFGICSVLTFAIVESKYNCMF
jgi:hypothetical protein